MKNNVLIVDDDPMVLSTVKRVLESAKLNVQTAESGDACLKILKSGFEGLILMDVIMPDMDGWDTIEAMVDGGYNQGNIVCMLTGKEMPDERMAALKEYILDYVRKPFDNKQLIALVKQYLSYLD